MNVILLIRNLLFLSLGFIVLIAFSNFLEVTFFELFVNEKLEYANSSFLLDFVVIAALILYISLTVNKCLFTIPKKTITFFLLIVISFYIYERSFNDFFEFTRFRISDSFAYFDVAFVVVLMHFGHYLKFFVSTDTTDAQKNSIIDDSPISKDKDDQLEGLLKISADKIKKVILENKFAASFTIGLNGEWGDGGEPRYQINTTIQPKKTISTTRTLAKAIRDYEPIRERVSTYAFKCSEKLRKQNSCCRYITVFISTDRFQNYYYGNSLTITLMNPSNSAIELSKSATMALDKIFIPDIAYRKVGVIVSEFVPENARLVSLFDEDHHSKHRQLMNTIDTINKRLGPDKIKLGSMDIQTTWKMNQKIFCISLITHKW